MRGRIAIYQAVADTSATVGTFGHGYTYSGHPVACAVALETLRIYESDDIVGQSIFQTAETLPNDIRPEHVKSASRP